MIWSVSLIWLFVTDKDSVMQVTVYGMLTGAASIFVLTHPKHSPNVHSDLLTDHLFRRNTFMVVPDNLSGNREGVLAVAKHFVSAVAVPWTLNWETRATHANYTSSASE
jgi:hypothetical protein